MIFGHSWAQLDKTEDVDRQLIWWTYTRLLDMNVSPVVQTECYADGGEVSTAWWISPSALGQPRLERCIRGWHDRRGWQPVPVLHWIKCQKSMNSMESAKSAQDFWELLALYSVGLCRWLASPQLWAQCRHLQPCKGGPVVDHVSYAWGHVNPNPSIFLQRYSQPVVGFSKTGSTSLGVILCYDNLLEFPM